MDEISGSNAWIAVARQSFIIAQHPEHEDIVLFSHLKTNIRKKIKEAYAYKIKEHNYKNQNGIQIKTSFIEWENQIYKISTEAILNKDAYEKSRMEAAIQFILNWLEQYGQSLSSVIRENALSNGISKTTIFAALKIAEERGLILSEQAFSKQKMYTIAKVS